MFKILYAVSPHASSKIQLSRFLAAIRGASYKIKIAAFKSSFPQNYSVDWTLDALLNMFQPEVPTFDNDNFHTYFQQVKHFNPQLIISDLEHFTSHIGRVLDVPVWQCSSSMTYAATSQDDKVGSHLRMRYGHVIGEGKWKNNQRTHMLEVSDRNLACSHFGDAANPPQLKAGFEWIRPYSQIGKVSVPCQHNIVAGMLSNSKPIFSLLRNYPDSIAFTEFCHERYQNLRLKDIRDRDEYFCNLRNCNLFVCQGGTSFLADAFYNGKRCVVMPDFQDEECIINASFSEYLGLSTNIYDPSADISELMNEEVKPSHNAGIKQLHELIREIT